MSRKKGISERLLLVETCLTLVSEGVLKTLRIQIIFIDLTQKRLKENFMYVFIY